MIFTQDIEAIIFNRHQNLECDQMIILSGYVGPNPVQRLIELPFKTTVIYGMYGSDGIRRNLHEALVNLNQNTSKVNIKYSTIPVHSKCYVWLYRGRVIYALIGSANFSVNGLTTPFKEVLAETSRDSFDPLARYIAQVTEVAISCEDGIFSESKTRKTNEDITPSIFNEECKLSLIDRTGLVPRRSGLNWGLASLDGSHVNIDDAYIPIRKSTIREYSNLFPPKQLLPRHDVEEGRRSRHNDSIEIIWDDGTTMRGLLEGNQDEKGVMYPKQIASHPEKKILGQYLRKRLGVPSGTAITLADLDRYGRRDIEITLQAEGIYLFDFSVNDI